MTKQKAKLILEDGSKFSGYGFGSDKNVTGEVVFNTGMVGYPETMTDPSYCGQILTFTFPLIGNYGVPGKERENGLLKNFESEKIHLRGIIVSDYSFEYSHWNAKQSLHEWMVDENIPGIYGIDTRMLTRKLREKGTMLGKIVFENTADELSFEDPNKTNLVSEVSIKEPVAYQKGKKKLVFVDCGTKNNIVQAFLRRDITVIRVPYNYDFLSIEADGIVLSNGPGDPKMNPITIENTRRAMA
ncbi:MAG: carbamoyl phosphate synthase small subunit, partial [Ignavibacteria bacterium CG22_combo_CG10-13_8_21_14_all_37_15]